MKLIILRILIVSTLSQKVDYVYGKELIKAIPQKKSCRDFTWGGCVKGGINWESSRFPKCCGEEKQYCPINVARH